MPHPRHDAAHPFGAFVFPSSQTGFLTQTRATFISGILGVPSSHGAESGNEPEGALGSPQETEQAQGEDYKGVARIISAHSVPPLPCPPLPFLSLYYFLVRWMGWGYRMRSDQEGGMT